MKTLRFLFSALIALALIACSNDLTEDLELQNVEIEEPSLTANKPDPAAGIGNYLIKLQTVEQANNLGYVTLFDPFETGGFFPGMGYHYVNLELVDDKFNPTQPEAVLVYCGEIIGVEYVVLPKVEGERGDPPGFGGKNTEWAWNEIVGGWTLHAWTHLENPAGFYNPTNPLVPATDECSGD